MKRLVSVTEIFSVRYIIVWMQVLVCGCRYECVYVCNFACTCGLTIKPSSLRPWNLGMTCYDRLNIRCIFLYEKHKQWQLFVQLPKLAVCVSVVGVAFLLFFHYRLSSVCFSLHEACLSNWFGLSISACLSVFQSSEKFWKQYIYRVKDLYKTLKPKMSVVCTIWYHT